MSKNIVVCCDGTGNEYNSNNTNVVKLYHIIKKDPQSQIAYYDPGVGTFSSAAAFTKTAKFITKLWGLAFAYGITNNIEDAYEYLMDKFEEGDKVFLFGFSRGAFTVRALAGMLKKCGLLQKGSNNLIPYASKMYRFGDSEVAEGFKQTFSRECNPHFIGVWDTVKSVGLIRRRKFPNAELNKDVKFGRHAISIDEVRSKYRPNLWDEPACKGQSIKQVWFAGVHSDVGGSYPEHGLSDIALEWIIDEAEKCGLEIDEKRYNEEKRCKKIAPNHKDKLHNPLFPFWWILGWWKRKVSKEALIHPSVFDRIRDVKNYKPKNLSSHNRIGKK
ncbi:MAG: DUF2235 domain-containing protein [Candidatus Aminicenantes bacterium]|jgi:uncharacterized protein (DUF2235 family)